MSKPIGSCELNNFLGQKCIAGQMFVELCNEVQLMEYLKISSTLNTNTIRRKQYQHH